MKKSTHFALMCAKSPHFSHFECTNLCKFADFAPCPDYITYATLPQPTEIMTENMTRNTKNSPSMIAI